MIDIVFDKVQKSDFAKFKNLKELRTAVNQHVRTIEASGLSAAWKRKLIRVYWIICATFPVSILACHSVASARLRLISA
jgi:hypothetical protein